MPRFRYRARIQTGELIVGTDTAESAEEVLRRLEADGAIPIEIGLPEVIGWQQSTGDRFLRLFNPVGKRDVAMFANQLSTLLGAGVALTRSLRAISKQVRNEGFRKTVLNINTAVEGGATLGEALEAQKSLFDDAAISMVRAGEASGNLEAALHQVAQLIEYQIDVSSKVSQATRYPKIVIFALCCAASILMTFVVPKFQFLFSMSKRVQLPLPTRLLIFVSTFARNNWIYLLVFVGISWATWKLLLTYPDIRLFWDRVRLHIPLIGPIRVRFAFSQFSRSLSNMIRAGMSVVTAFELSAGVIGNTYLSRAIKWLLDDLIRGKTLTAATQDTGVFPPMVEQMIAVGEESGQLDTMLDKVSQYYDNEIDIAIKRLSTIIEPLLTAMVGGIVLVFALAIFLPMWEMLSVLKSQTHGGMRH